MLGQGAIGQYAIGEGQSALSSINAALAQTIGPVTVSATLANVISASVSQTIGAVTVVATAKNVISASLNSTIAAVTISATAVNVIAANVAATIGPVTVSGTFGNVISASLNATIDPVTLSTAFFLQDGPAGGVVVGGTFSRGRWHDLLEAQRAERESERQAKLLKRKRLRAAAKDAAAKARLAVLEARKAQQSERADQERIRQLSAALSSFNSMQGIQDAMRQSGEMAAHAHHAKMMANDEEEALALLMLHG